MRYEIQRQGLLMQMNELKTRLGSLQDNLENTEKEFNNTALEAMVVSKLDKLAANFCDAGTMCNDQAKKPLVREWLRDKVISSELKKSLSPAASQNNVPATR